MFIIIKTDASIKYIEAKSNINGFFIYSPHMLINTILGNDGSSGFQFIMQYKNYNAYCIIVGQAPDDDFTKFKRVVGTPIYIWYIIDDTL